MRRLGFNELLIQTVLYAAFLFIALLCAYPFYYMLLYSFSDPLEVLKHNIVLLPVGFTFKNYAAILELPNIFTSFIVSLLRTVLGTTLSVFMTSLFAYVLTQRELWGRKLFYRLTVVSMYLNAGLIPWYITMKAYGLKNSFWLYLLPSAIGAFNLILVKTFIEQTPFALQESARIDGAGRFRIFWQIVFPLCKPVVAAIAVFAAVTHWNSWVDNFYLVRTPHLQTLQLTLLNYILEANNIAQQVQNNATNVADIKRTLTPTSIRMTLTMFVTIPILLVYPFMQKFFIKGMLLGSVKG